MAAFQNLQFEEEMSNFRPEITEKWTVFTWNTVVISVRIGTITSEISFGCQPSPRTSGLVWDNQNLLLGDGSLNR